MQMDYKSLEDYIASTKGKKNEAKLLTFIKKNSDSLEMGDLADGGADSFELESFDAKRVKCEKTDNPDNNPLYPYICNDIRGRIQETRIFPRVLLQVLLFQMQGFLFRFF